MGEFLRWCKRGGLLLACLVPAGLAAGVTAPTASALCNPGFHCYLIDKWPSAPQNALIDAIMNPYCVYSTSPSNSFATEEIWEGTNNSNYGTYWVETGTASGYPTGSSNRFWFWADNRPSYGYDEHAPLSGISTALNTTYALEINWQGPANEWAVWINGSNVGNSTSNPAYSQYVQGRAEFINDAVRAAANFWDLDWYTPAGARTLSWSGYSYANGPGAVGVGPAPQTTFDTYYAGTGTCTVPSDIAAPSTTPAAPAVTPETMEPVPSDQISAAVQSQLMQHVVYMASSTGDGAAGNVTVVPTTRYAANKLVSGDTVNNGAGQPDTTGVYLVQVTGSFMSLRVGPDGQAITGSAITFAVDPATNQILDWGVYPSALTAAQLASLGTPTVLQESGS